MELAFFKFVGTITGIIGAILVALNIPESAYGFLFFTTSSISWGIAAVKMRETSLMFLQGVFLIVNIMGVWRWFS